MPATRRDLLELGALAVATGASANTATTTVQLREATTRAERPLNILILGGTGFTGPHQLRLALARGHKITLFDRGRRP